MAETPTQDRLFLLRRDAPGPRSMTPDEVLRAARQSTGTVGQEIHWVDGFATEDRVLLVYAAPSEEIVRRYAELSGLAATEIVEVKQRLAGVLA